MRRRDAAHGAFARSSIRGQGQLARRARLHGLRTAGPVLTDVDMLLEDKTLIVTGGSHGIGRAVALAAAAAGANVVVGDRSDAEGPDSVASRIARDGRPAMGCNADVGRIDDLAQLIRAAVQRFGRLDVMVNNAGIEKRRSLLEATEADYDEVMRVNMKGVFFGTQLAARQFVAQGGGGVIINMSSVHEDWPMPGNVTYCVAKGGVRMLTRTAALELGAHGIRVVNVGPGAVDTALNQQTRDDAAELEQLRAAIPLGRMAQPDEIADLVVFLASDRARYLTATTVFADGGLMRGSPGL